MASTVSNVGPPGPAARSFNHLVRPCEQHRRYIESQCVGSLQIDHQFELGRRLQGKIARIGALQDPVDVGCGAAEDIGGIDAVRNETAARSKHAQWIDCGQAVARCQRNDQITMAGGEGIRQDDQAAGRLGSESSNSAFELAIVVGHGNDRLDAKGRGRILDHAYERSGKPIAATDREEREVLMATDLPGILIVDDNEDNRYTLQLMLENDGHERIASAAGGNEAIALIEKEKFSLVLLDLMMPDLNGDEVLKVIKSDPNKRDIPVVMISADTNADKVSQCIELGADDYMPKPFNPTILRARIAAALRRHSLRALESEYLGKIENEKRHSENLLRNILPAEVVTRLRKGESNIADHFDDATVIFADVVGFGKITARMKAYEIVACLNQLFSEFDKLAEDAGIEKIKTIGDNYMAVAGVPTPCSNHARMAAKFALDTVAATGRLRSRLPVPFSIRVGLHSGPVMAGVIGTRKFAYDVWGDTVSIAARLEAASQPNRVLASAATVKGLGSDYRFDGPHKIDNKEDRVLEAFFVSRHP
jgi:class 3 adenylate cyclase/CheY-like chemotaxis protein